MPRSYGLRGVPLVRKYLRKRTFSTRERLLIHLSSEALRPGELTQEGIAAATQSGRSTLTKWLDLLEEQGLVARERIRFDRRPLPRFAYRLTESGWQEASVLRERIASQIITVQAPGAGPLTVRMSEVPNLASARLDLTRALTLVRKGRLDLARLPGTARGRAPVTWGSGLRRIDRLFGRRGELEAMDVWYRSETPVLLVTGIAGIGKSSLVAAWVQGRPHKVAVYGFEIHGSSTQAGLLADFGAFLAALGKPGLATQLSQGVPLDLAFVRRLLMRDLAGVSLVVILDNADKASRGVARLVNGLFVEVSPKLEVKVVLLGRRSARWMSHARQGAPTHETLSVSGLDPKSSEALLRYRGLGPNSTFIQEIVRKTRGHPLLLHLAASTGASRSSAVQRYLKDEVWDSLSTEDRATLEAASVFRNAVNERVLAKVAGTDRHRLGSLTERSLLDRTIAGSYTIHDLVREFVQGQLSDERRGRLHSLAADALLHATDPHERLEGAYHLLEAGRVVEAAAFLDSAGTPLVDSVAAEEISSMVGRLTLDESQSETYCVFAELLGDGLRIRGHIGPALFQYGHARRLAENSRRPERTPRILRKMAFLERCRNRYPKALGYLIEARARLGDVGDSAERAEVLREMALAEQALGGLAAAAKHLGEAIDIATDMSDRAALSRGLLALGSLEELRGHRELGLNYELEGLRIAEQSGNLTEVARAAIVVGTGLVGMGRTGESLAYYEKGLELARLLGNLRLVAYATMDRSACLIDLGRFDEAGQDLRDAEGAFKILEEPETLALLRVYEGNRQMGMGRVTSAKRIWRMGFEDLRRQGSKIDLVRGLTDVGTLCADQGENDEAMAYLGEAKNLAKELGNAALSSEIDATLNRIDKAVSRNLA